MSEATFKCRLCGHCCLNLVDAYRGCVTDEDLELWRREGRDDLLAWVETLDLGRDNRLHTIWIDPETKDDVDRCPWLRELPEKKGYACSINDVKPHHCRAYPEHHRHGQQTGCPACTE